MAETKFSTAIYTALTAAGVTARKRRAEDERSLSAGYAVYSVTLQDEPDGWVALVSVTIDVYASTEATAETLAATIHGVLDGWRVQDTDTTAGRSGDFTAESRAWVGEDIYESPHIEMVYTGWYAAASGIAALS